MPAVTQQGTARLQVQPWHSQFSSQGAGELCPALTLPSFHLSEQGRGEPGQAPLSAGPACRPWEGIPPRQPHSAAATLRTDGLQLMSLLAPLTLESLPGIKATRSPPGRLVTLEVAPRRLAVHQCA